MNVIHEISAPSSAGLALAQGTDGLQALKEPACPGIIWQREIDETLLSWVRSLDRGALPQTRQILRVNDLGGVMLDVCEASGTPDTPERALLVDHIVGLAEAFNELVPSPFLRLRLSVVTTNSCRKFHIDNIRARLICTYRGTGTQCGLSSDGKDPEEIQTVPTGMPVLLRGLLWPTEPSTDLVHRSPPIEGTGETRLILVLDPIFDPDEED